MVKNVKDSKFLKKIRMRDGAFDFLIFLESHKDEVRQLKNKEEMSRLFSKYNMSLLRENTNALWERVQEIKKTKDSKTHDEPTNNIKKLSEKLSSAGFQPRISGDGFSIDVFEKGKEVGSFSENKDNSFAVDGLSSRKLYDWIMSNGGSVISLANGLARFPRISKDSKVKDMKVTITIEGEDVVLPNEPVGVSKSAEPAPEELIPFEGEIYKGFEDCGISGLWSTL